MISIDHLNSSAALFSRAFDSTIVREDLLSQNEPRQLSALQQVLAFMTIGRDMSGYFSDIAPLCSSTNLTIKRLVYLYLMHNSHSQQQKAVLQAGTFVKDTLNDSPLIRGAALRTMTSLLVPVMVDFIIAPLQRCLQDSDPYVRSIAAFGTLKLFYIAPNVCEEAGLLDKLKNQLQDENARVVASAVASILELRQRYAPIWLEEAIVDNVSHVIESASEVAGWYQHYLLEGAAVVFKGSSPRLDVEKSTAIADRVMPFLSSFNLATVMSAVKVITSFLLQSSGLLALPALRNDNDNEDNNLFQMQNRYGPKLVGTCVSLLYVPCFEVRYAVYRNIRLLLKTELKRFFKRYLGLFFIKYDDPIYIKLEKSEVLLELADVEVGEMILSDFTDFATDTDKEMAQMAIRSIGLLAVKVEPLAAKCVEKLLSLFDTGISHVVQDTAIVVQTVLRRYPKQFTGVVTKVCAVLEDLHSAESKAAVAWVLGEYAGCVENLGEILDLCIESFSSQARIMQFALLTAVVKIYLQSDPKEKERNTNYLQRVLSMATQSPIPDVRDRAFMYWRLVSSDGEAAKKLLLRTSKNASFVVVSAVDKHRLQRFLLNIGSLASVLHRPLHLIYDNQVLIDENDEEEEENVENDNDNEQQLAQPTVLYNEDTISCIESGHNNVGGHSSVREEDMQLVLSAEEGSGLEVRMAWSQLGNKLVLNCRFSLLPGDSYARRVVIQALQINRNIYALGLAEECPLVGLELGQKEPDTIQLLTGTNNEKSSVRDLLVAVNADPIGTRYFLAPPVPPAMLLLPATGVDSGFFFEEFQRLQAPSWIMPAMITSVRTDPTQCMVNALRLHGLSLVYSGKLNDSGIVRIFLFAETIAAQKLYMEAVVQNNIVVYFAVRCKDAQVSPVFGAYALKVLSLTKNIEN